MIAASELRIGNWVKSICPHDYKLVKFKRFDEDLKVAFFYKEFIGAFIEHIEPIELSPEILEKCGFEWSIYHQAYHFGSPLVNEFYDLNECYPKGFQLSTFKKGQLIGISIIYLHQLQNLYFALTNQELTYDSTK